MKLYLVMIVLGKVGATWGPLPYPRAECKLRAALLAGETDVKFKPIKVKGVLIKRSDIDYKCMVGDRPNLDDPWVQLGDR